MDVTHKTLEHMQHPAIRQGVVYREDDWGAPATVLRETSRDTPNDSLAAGDDAIEAQALRTAPVQ
jgi:hypothetical protein